MHTGLYCGAVQGFRTPENGYRGVGCGAGTKCTRLFLFILLCFYAFASRPVAGSFYWTSVMRGEKGTIWKKNMSQVGVLLSVNTWKMLLDFVHSSGWRSRRLSDRKAAWKSGFHSLMQTVTAILASLILYSMVYRRYPGSVKNTQNPSEIQAGLYWQSSLCCDSLLSLNAAPLAFMCI